MELEVERLNTLKASKMKELVFKRQNELEEIYTGVHMNVDSHAAREILISIINSGMIILFWNYLFELNCLDYYSSWFRISIRNIVFQLLLFERNQSVWTANAGFNGFGPIMTCAPILDTISYFVF